MNISLRLPGRGSVEVKENTIDRAITAISPVRGRNRLQARVQMALAGAYKGARKNRRQTSEWKVSSGDANADLLSDLPVLRERSRDLERNNPLATGVINTNCTNIVGTGLKLQSRIDRDILNISEDDAAAKEKSIESEFKLFAETKDCDVGRTNTFALIQELALRSTLVNGDVLALLPKVKRVDNPYSLKVQLIEADRLSNSDFKSDTDTLAGGVEKDRHGAPIRYHISKQHPGIRYSSSTEWDVIQAFGSKTGRRNIIHLFRMTRPGQTRGVPYLAPVIESLKQIDRYTEAELMAAVVSGLFTVFIKTEAGDGELAPMEPTAEVGGTSTDKDYKMGNGAILGLGLNESIESANPQRPNTAFDPFVMAVLRQVGVALEIPFEILIKHFTASYSAARAAILEAWKFFLARRKWLADNFCQLIFEEFMWEAVALGRISAPGFINDPLIRKAYLSSEWVGPTQGQIDPKKEADAAVIRVDNGFSTVAQETAAMTGGDFDKNVPQIEKERKIFKEIGLTQAPVMPTEPTEPDDPDDKGDEEDE